MLREVAEAADVDENEVPTGVDGCGVVTFALPLERMAYAFSRLPQLDGGGRVVAAMRSNPELIRGPGAPDTELMQGEGGWVAKGGAEGLMCAVDANGLGVALKVEDGGSRAVGPASDALLSRLGLGQKQGSPKLMNSRGQAVGEINAE
jgi:L-asparaginase II